MIRRRGCKSPLCDLGKAILLLFSYYHMETSWQIEYKEIVSIFQSYLSPHHHFSCVLYHLPYYVLKNLICIMFLLKIIIMKTCTRVTGKQPDLE